MSDGPRVLRIEKRIAKSMLHNSGVFLKKAAHEIVGHQDIRDRPFDADRATLIMVLIQTAVELAAAALIIEADGLAGIMVRDVPGTAAEIERRWRDGSIQTKSFSQIKARAQALFGDTDFWTMIDHFQSTRNKLVHFHQPLHTDDYYDLKFEATHVLIQLVATLASTDDYSLSDGSRSFLGQELFDALMTFVPYRDRIVALAEQADPGVIACMICDLRAFSPEAEMCLACGFAGEIKLLKCPHCKQRALYYDHLNLPFNSSLLARCGNCDQKAETAHCKICELDYVVEGGWPPICPWAADHNEIAQLNLRH